MSTDQEQLAALDQDLKRLRAEYDQSILDFLEVKRSGKKTQVAAFDKCHAAGLALFNAHESAIPLDSRLNMDLNPTCYTERSETSENVLDTICIHFETLHLWAADLGLDPATLRPSPTAFAHMQRRVMESQSETAATLRERFAALGLPTRGFDTPEAKSSRSVTTAAGAPQANYYTGCAIGDGARVEAGSINSSHNGGIHVGDKINISGNVTGSAVGSHASLKARDIVTQIQQQGTLGDDIEKAFKGAADALDALQAPEGTKEDVADDLAKLKKELEKQTKDEGRIKTIWDRINGIASTVATALSAAASIGKIVLGSGS